MSFDVEIEYKSVHVNGEELKRHYGGTRDVFMGKDVVLKLNDYHHWNQNKSEIKKWKNAKSNLKKHLAPILGHAADGSWLIQKKVSQRTPRGTTRKKAYRTVVRLAQKLKLTDFGFHHNWGFYKGKPVFFDYAYIS